jgi:hypothetical protein
MNFRNALLFRFSNLQLANNILYLVKAVIMDTSAKLMIDGLETKLNDLRPYTRQEFRAMMEPALAGLDEPLKKLAFDYERSPYIEKRGIGDGRKIVSSVPPDAFPDPVVFLFVCLQRVESFLYEKVRTVSDDADADEQLTLMYRSGVFKVIKTLSGLLPDNAREVWSFRRKALNIIEDKLWKMICRTGDAASKDRNEIVLLADILLALPPLDMK